MKMILDALSSALMFKALNTDQLRTFAAFWERQEISPDAVLWEQGMIADEMALLAAGRLAVRVDGAHITNIRVGEVLGETGVFVPDATRTADVYALERSVLLTLSREALGRLRKSDPDIYGHLLSEALKAMTQRIRTVSKELRRTLTGSLEEAPTRVEPSAMAKMWKALRPGRSARSAPPLIDIFKAVPGLKTAPHEALITLAKAFVPKAYEAGETLFIEGEDGGELYIIAEGEVDLIRHVRGKSAERMAQLAPGDILGVSGAVDGGKRASSCVVTQAGWIYQLSQEAFQALEGEPRLCLYECLLTAARAQLTSANALLSDVRASDLAEMIKMNPKMSEARLQKLLKASGFLEGGTLY